MFAALVPFARVAGLLSELPPIGGAVNACTARNRTLRVGLMVEPAALMGTQIPEPDDAASAVVVGLDGGNVRSRHRRSERTFEIIAGKVMGADGNQHRFAFARNGGSVDQFAHALVRAGVRDGAPATVLSHGDAGLRNLQRRVLPRALVVLDWFHIALRFEHALQTATGLGIGTVDAHPGAISHGGIKRAKGRLWHGRWQECLIQLVRVSHWPQAKRSRDVEGMRPPQHHLRELLAYLEANQSARVDYAARRRSGEPISTAFVERAVNEGQQMCQSAGNIDPGLECAPAGGQNQAAV
jgi:hypothetical protein